MLKVVKKEEMSPKGRGTLGTVTYEVYDGVKNVTKEHLKVWDVEDDTGVGVLYIEKGQNEADLIKELEERINTYKDRKEYLKTL